MSGTHGEKSQSLFDQMMATAPEAQEPAVPAPRQRQEAQAAPEPVPAAKPVAARRAATGPKPKPGPALPATAAVEAVRGYSVSVDRDLHQLLRIARRAFGGAKVGRLMLAAAREHRHHASELPDLAAPVAADDFYGEVAEAVPRSPVVMTAYWTPTTKSRVDADAAAAGLDRSAFIGRTLRAHLTVDVVFVPDGALAPLHSPQELLRLASELKTADRPARALPDAAGHAWTAYPVPEGHPLREALDAARAAMPGCLSATQALLTILPRPDGD